MTSGIWLPAEGVYEAKKVGMTPQQDVQLHSALSARSLSRTSDFKRRDVQESFRAAIHEVFRADEVPSEQLSPPVRVVFAYKTVNRPVDESEFAITIQRSIRDLMSSQGCRKRPGRRNGSLTTGLLKRLS